MGANAANVTKAARNDFLYSNDLEPHTQRRLEILKKYPEIKELFGFEWRTKYIIFATVVLQVFMAWLTLEWQWPLYLLAVYAVGATANHSLFLVIHELVHNLGASTPFRNKWISIFANLPVGAAYAITYKPYHMDHHRLGQEGIDTDVPTRLEGWFITTSSYGYIDHTLKKAVFVFFNIFAYALRPCLTKPEVVPKDLWMVANWCVQLAFDGAIVAWLGPKGMLYFALSTFLAGSFHPLAGHFLAEHYVTDGNAETYSYYGPLNMLSYNVGYHNEHHDFPSIPWSNLPKVRKIAPSFYDDLPQCKSWPGMIFRYIFDDSITPFSRVVRNSKRA